MNRWLKRVLGEGDTVPQGAPADEPGSEVATALAQAWQSGSRDSVAAQLLLSPIKYADFAHLCFLLGDSESTHLGNLMDTMHSESNTPESDASGDQITSDASAVLPVPPGTTS